MLTVALFSACIVFAGFALSLAVWSRDSSRPLGVGGLGPLELLASSLLSSLFLTTAVNWLLASAGLLSRATLLLAAVALALSGALFLFRQRREQAGAVRVLEAVAQVPLGIGLLTLLCISVPVSLWLLYMAWRGTLTPVLSHDALSYHLPRALDMVRTGGWRYLPVEDFRLAWFPANYEMMLADIILLTQRGDATNSLSVVHYAIALLFAAAYGERRWGAGTKAWLVALAWGASPIALLHAGAHKSDLLSMICVLAVAMFGSRWLVRGGVAPFAFALAAAALGVGTKTTGVVVAPALFLAFLPFGLFTQLRATLPTPRAAALFALSALVLLFLGGIVPYLAHVRHLGDMTASGFTAEELFTMNISPSYGRLSNFWTFPLLLLIRPFSLGQRVWVPWASQYWFWPRYEFYFSDFGAFVSLAVALIPLALALRKRGPQGDTLLRRERGAASAFLVVFTLLVIPIYYRIDGFYNGFPRYLLFLPLLVMDAGLVALLEKLGRGRRAEQGASLALIAVALVYSFEAVRAARRDRFAPFDYVVYLANHPDYHRPFFAPDLGRAEQIIDDLAGPNDRVVVDAGFGAWVYPAFGANLTRSVSVLPIDAAEREKMLASADWVAIDRYWSICWGAPELRTMGDMLAYVDHGALARHDIEVIDAMKRDPRFVIMFDAPERGQFVFRRAAE